ncbi:MAG: hypothetical protein H6923_07990 [Alphaproteobacteria bacterium]|nr:hypothetical protein [Alphaproteobacteria bacterium]
MRNRALDELLSVEPAKPPIARLREACAGILREGALPRPDLADPAFARAVAIACRVWSGDLADPTHGATRYHPHAEEPAWAHACRATALLGRLCFYRMPGGRSLALAGGDPRG